MEVLEQHEDATQWRDGKRWLWALAPLLPLTAFAAWGLNSATKLGFFWWIGPILLYAIIPVLDHVVGRDTTNPPEEAVPGLEQNKYYRYLTYLWVVFQYAALVWFAWMLASKRLDFVDKIGGTLGLGIIAGLAIATAHELGHKRTRIERWLAKISLAQTSYGHFYVEHNKGHHARVATPEDPASARFGESFWRFLPRSVIGGIKSGWRLETDRLDRIGRHHLSIENNIVQTSLMTVVLFAVLTIVFGPFVLPLLLVQAVFGFTLLESVNYIEHYGLMRQKTPSGRYEPVRPEHSWNSNNVVSNILLFHLERHSDHHAFPGRRYQSLRNFDEAPQLPGGYATMLILSYFPPLWRKVMDPRVLAHYSGDLSKVNVQPGKNKSLTSLQAPAAAA